MLKSKCCSCDVRSDGDDGEGTYHWVCCKCNNPCDVVKVEVETTVVNMHTCHDVDIVAIDRTTVFGNPFKIDFSTSRKESIDKYEWYFNARILRDDEFRKAVQMLRGKKLGCWCAPLPCHGNIIVKYLNSHKDVKEQGK